MTRLLVAILPLLLMSPGCREPDSVLLATLDCDPNAAPSRSIQVMLSEPGREDTKIFPGPSGQPLHFSTSLTLVIPRSHSGQLDLAFLALDGDSKTTAHATAKTMLTGGAETAIEVKLSAGNDLCGNMVVDPGEECDDGNLFSFDGCDDDCQLESPASSVPPDAGSTTHPDTLPSGLPDTNIPDTQQPDALPIQPQDAITNPDSQASPTPPDSSPLIQSPDSSPLPPDLQPSLAPLGSPCTVDSLCDSGFCDHWETKPTCSTRQPLGGPCTFGMQCESGSCSDYKCIPIP